MGVKHLLGAITVFGAITFMSVAAHAATTYSAGSVTTAAGETITVPVCATSSDGTDTINGYIIKLTYDPTELTPNTADNDATDSTNYASIGTNYADGIIVSDITETSDTENTLTIAWASANAVTVSTAQDILSTVSFTVSESAADDSTIDVAVASVATDENSIADTSTYSTASGTISLSSTYVLGDVNGNSEIEAVDSTLLFQYVSGSITLDELKAQVTDSDNVEARADINKSDEIEAVDSTLLFQFVSGSISSFE